MQENAFRITIKCSRYRQVFLISMTGLILVSVWVWQQHVLQYQLLIQLLLSLVLIAWCAQQLAYNEAEKVLTLKESGELKWLQPPDDTPWQVASESRFNRYLMWLKLHNSILQKQQNVLIFNDSVSDVHWRHLCRIVSKI